MSAASSFDGVVGAVPSGPLLSLLSKLSEDDLDIDITEQEFLVKGKGRRASIRMEVEIAQSMSSVDMPEEWTDLHPDFAEAVDITQACASREDSSFVRTCIHVATDRLESCDNAQMAYYPIDTGLEESCLIRRTALVPMIGLGMTEIGVTRAWMHFRNPDGLVMSCRKWVEDFEDLSEVLVVENGEPATLPPGLADAVGKAEIFSAESIDSNQVRIELRKNKLKIRGEGAAGWYEERKDIQYDGQPLVFQISPKLLIEITNRTNECVVAPGRLKIDAGKFTYIVCLNVAK